MEEPIIPGPATPLERGAAAIEITPAEWLASKQRQEYALSVTGGRFLPYPTRGESSEQCLDAGLNCSIDPATGRCTECGVEEAD